MAVRASRHQAIVLVGMHGIALLAAMQVFEGPAIFLVSIGTLASAMWCAANSLHWLSGAVAAFEIFPDGTGSWTDCLGASHSANIIKVTWCSEALVVLGFGRPAMSWQWLILTTDSAEPEDLRCLRIWARWRPH